jgi:hypothetical protein
MEVVWILVEIWRMDSFQDEAMCHMQEVHRVDIFQDYASQIIAVHFLIWDPGVECTIVHLSRGSTVYPVIPDISG